jgi:hypothetical protein
VKCLGCEHVNREEKVFCTQCGAALPIMRKTCRSVNDPGDKFCGGCGSELADEIAKSTVGIHNARQPSQIIRTNEHPPSGDIEDEAERRPLTIMFTDLVGSTEMSLKIDAEDLRDIITSYQISCAQAKRRAHTATDDY